MRGSFAHIAEHRGSDKISFSMFLNTRIWGFAFLRAWVYVMFVGLGASSLTLTETPLPAAAYQWSTLALCVTLFLGALAYKKMGAALFDARVRWLATILTTLGTLLGFVFTALKGPLWLVALFGGVATGVGSGLLSLGYGEIYRNRPPSEVDVEIPMAALIAGIVYAFSGMVPPLAGVALASLLPLVSGVIMTLQNHTWQPHNTVKASPLVRSSLGFLLRIGLCTCVVGFADGVVRLIFMAVAHVSANDFYHPGMLLSSIVMAALLVGFVLIWRRSTFRGFYKLITFTIAASIVLTPVFTAVPSWSSLLGLIGYNTFNVFIWVLLANITYSLRLPATFVFGLGWGFLTAGNTMGQIAGNLIVEAVEPSLLILSLVSGLAALAIFALFVFVLKDDDLVDIKKIPFTVEAEDETAASNAEAGISDTQAGTAPDGDEPQPGSFQWACLEMAREQGLTPRETEIMLLFARGRTSTYIQEELFISRGTVTTHLQHIYRKAGVHSKQELLDLIESKLPEA